MEASKEVAANHLDLLGSLQQELFAFKVRDPRWNRAPTGNESSRSRTAGPRPRGEKHVENRKVLQLCSRLQQISRPSTPAPTMTSTFPSISGTTETFSVSVVFLGLIPSMPRVSAQ